MYLNIFDVFTAENVSFYLSTLSFFQLAIQVVDKSDILTLQTSKYYL